MNCLHILVWLPGWQIWLNTPTQGRAFQFSETLRPVPESWPRHLIQ